MMDDAASSNVESSIGQILTGDKGPVQAQRIIILLVCSSKEIRSYVIVHLYNKLLSYRGLETLTIM